MTSLSICIPIFNFGAFIPETLDSILAQADESTEIVVFDGGSTDNTPEVMARYQDRRVRYVRAATRGGFDADTARTISLATSEYCWIFSGDDVMRPGAIAQARQWIARGADVYVCRHSICDVRMRWKFDHLVMDEPDRELVSQFSDRDQRLGWFRRAATSEAFFSFMSGLIVRKAAWDRGFLDPRFDRTCWAHVARLFALGPGGLQVVYVPHVWLDQRGDNDSFVNAGVVNRYRIGIAGYQAIAAAIYGAQSEEAFHVRRVLRNEFTLRMFLNGKVLCRERPEVEDRRLLDQLYADLHSDFSWRSVALRATYRAIPAHAAAWLRSGVRALRKRGIDA